MPAASWLALAALLVVLGCSSGPASFSPTAAPTSVETDTAIASVDVCRSDVTYRAAFQERDPATDQVLVEILHEVSGDQLRIEASNGVRVLLLGDDTWSYEEGVWEQLASTPVRPLRIPWVNNFITGAEIADAFSPQGSASVGVIGASVYRPTLDEMSEAFNDRFRDIEYDPAGTNFEYWVDACGDTVFAELTITFGAEEAERSEQAGLPATLGYGYELYDIDSEISAITPETDIDTISRPPD